LGLGARLRAAFVAAACSTGLGIVLLASAWSEIGRAQSADPIVFRLRLAQSARAQMDALGLTLPVKGRVFVLLSRDLSQEPRTQVGMSGIPLWGMDVDGFGDQAVEVAVGGANVRGYPVSRPVDLPAGRYRAQAFLNVYTRFSRADGHELWLHHDRGEGQDLWTAPGNAYSVPVTLDLAAARGGSFELVLDKVVPPIEAVPPDGVLDQGNPVDTEHVKFVKIRSELLSRFWGRPMYVGANVLLPRDYARGGASRYPTIYLQGHFPGRAAPFGFQEPGAGGGSAASPSSPSGAQVSGARVSRGRGFSDFWLSGAAPRLVVVTIRDANPYYDTSYSVNSDNVGPYGDAITRELMPYLERQFRLVSADWGRVVAGGSTGGWEAMALQVFYPNLFAGAWSWCPDSLDFRHHQVVNIYDDRNAYAGGTSWVPVERPNSRAVDGNVLTTIRQENAFEATIGPHHRSGGQWAIWEAVFGPTGEDGYPQPLWDPETGAIDTRVAEAWRQRSDLSEYLRREWSRLASRLAGRLHVAVGDMDTYFLEQGVYAFEERIRTLSPPANATFEYGARKPHCWTGASPSGSGVDLSDAEFVAVAARFIAARAPRDSDLSWMTLPR
jgi:hypothetical protein